VCVALTYSSTQHQAYLRALPQYSLKWLRVKEPEFLLGLMFS
jgi:hypothetical protein